jgi:hypothetical protein
VIIYLQRDMLCIQQRCNCTAAFLVLTALVFLVNCSDALAIQSAHSTVLVALSLTAVVCLCIICYCACRLVWRVTAAALPSGTSSEAAAPLGALVAQAYVLSTQCCHHLHPGQRQTFPLLQGAVLALRQALLSCRSTTTAAAALCSSWRWLQGSTERPPRTGLRCLARCSTAAAAAPTGAAALTAAAAALTAPAASHCRGLRA